MQNNNHIQQFIDHSEEIGRLKFNKLFPKIYVEWEIEDKSSVYDGIFEDYLIEVKDRHCNFDLLKRWKTVLIEKKKVDNLNKKMSELKKKDALICYFYGDGYTIFTVSLINRMVANGLKPQMKLCRKNNYSYEMELKPVYLIDYADAFKVREA